MPDQQRTGDLFGFGSLSGFRGLDESNSEIAAIVRSTLSESLIFERLFLSSHSRGET